MHNILRELKKRRGILIIISAPSGSGKTTLCKALLRSIPDLAYSISYTTREARLNEENTKDYFFVSKEQFKGMKAKGCFAEWAMVHGNYYGTSTKTIEENLKKGMGLLLELDVVGTKKIKKRYKETVSIFLIPPSLSELKKRLKKRGQNSQSEIKKRLQCALKEINEIPNYDYIVINDKLENALSIIKSIIQVERVKVSKILSSTKIA